MAARVTTLLVVLMAWLTLPVAAGELPRTHFKVLVQDSPSPQTKVLEVPFWMKTVPEAANGQVTADTTPIDQVAIDDKAVLRLLKLGVFEFASMDISKMAGDDPRFEGCDLAGISLDIDVARKACNAYRGVIDRLMQEKWGSKLLAMGTAPPQVFWCRAPIQGLADLKGKKVRVFNKTMVDFLGGVGAEAVAINFSEVVPALQRGVVDCAVTGNLVGNTGGWTEVTTHLFPMYMGWSINVHAVNLETWKRIDPRVQQFMLDQFAKFEDKFWETMRFAMVDADNCNFGKEPCKMAKLAKMILVPVKPEEMELHKKLIETAVLRGWAKRAGAKAAQEWNETVGKVLGMTAPTN